MTLVGKVRVISMISEDYLTKEKQGEFALIIVDHLITKLIKRKHANLLRVIKMTPLKGRNLYITKMIKVVVDEISFNQDIIDLRETLRKFGCKDKEISEFIHERTMAAFLAVVES